MITLDNVTLRRDGRVLFSQASTQIHDGWHVGLTGNNGTGKSSLFAALLGRLSTDDGQIDLPDNWHIAHMAQEIAASNQAAIDFVLAGDQQWYRLNDQINNQESLTDVQIGQVYQAFDDIDGYSIPAKAAQIMAGLGFKTSQHQHKVSDFSGGWRMRLNLARTLMSRANLMLLDEPTNHLDLDAILWLEDWLIAYTGTLIMISHDKSFLDATVGHILHIENGAMTLYTGNYSTFLRTRSERLAQQQQAFEKQQETREKLQSYIDRFRAKATKAKQAQSRIKQLERMEALSPVIADSPFSFEFYEPECLSSPLIQLRDAAVGYENVPLITNIQLAITPDSRVGLLGMNGAGKSTVVKGVVGDLPLLSGSYRASDNLKLGYFNQHQMDALDNDATPMMMLRRLAGKTSDAVLRSFLGQFDFRGDRIETPSKLFSGGERARLTLALIVWQKPNVLVLDEPTNHLDLQMRQALTFALQQFAGAVVLVSHDREMIGQVCDQLYLVHDGQFVEFEDDIEGYSDWLKQAKKDQQNAEKKTSKTDHAKGNPTSSIDSGSTEAISGLTKEEKRKQAAVNRKKTAPLRKTIEQLEKKLDKAEHKLADYNEQLTDTSLYDETNKEQLVKLLAEQSDADQDKQALEDELLMAIESLEDMEQQLK